jgi:adenylosuccinate synthase
LAPHVADSGAEVRAAIAAGKRVLLEGAQGMFLDIDHGTYPYVTSSNCVSGAAAAGAGIPPKAIGRVIGIAKTYTTRVGGGPFPTELGDALGERLRADGDEYGATTGRPRRCGWFDAVVVRQAIALSGVDGIAFTKLDVLTGMDPVRICVAYEIDGVRRDTPPATQRAWARATPIYEDLPGWTEPLGEARSLADLPANARRYLDALVKAVGAPMVILSIGAGREQTVRLEDVF